MLMKLTPCLEFYNCDLFVSDLLRLFVPRSSARILLPENTNPWHNESFGDPSIEGVSCNNGKTSEKTRRMSTYILRNKK